MAMLTETLKCTGCGEVLPATTKYFSRSRAFKYNSNLSYRCKRCDKKRRDDYNEKHEAKVVAARKVYYDVNKDKIRSKVLLKSYGIDSEEYDRLLCLQSGVCAICKRPEACKRRGKILPLSVDHDHATGKVRGLLCTICNRGLGCFKDNPELLRSAAAYAD